MRLSGGRWREGFQSEQLAKLLCSSAQGSSCGRCITASPHHGAACRGRRKGEQWQRVNAGPMLGPLGANEGATALSTQVTASEGFAQHDARRCGSLAAVETRWPGRGCSGRRASAELVLVPKQPVCARSSAGGRWRAMAGNGGARPPRCRHGRPAAQKTHGTQSSRDTDMPLPSG